MPLAKINQQEKIQGHHSLSLRKKVSTVPLPRPRCLDRPLITESSLVLSRKRGQLTHGSECLYMLSVFNALYSLSLFHIFRADRSRRSLASVLSGDD